MTPHRASDITGVGSVALQEKDKVRKNSLPVKGEVTKKQPPAPPVRRVGFGGGNPSADVPPPASSVAPPAFDVMLLKQMVENSVGLKKPVNGMDGADSSSSSNERLSAVKKSGESRDDDHAVRFSDSSTHDRTSATRPVAGTYAAAVAASKERLSQQAAAASAGNVVSVQKTDSVPVSGAAYGPVTVATARDSSPPPAAAQVTKDPRVELVQQLQRKLDIEVKVKFAAEQLAEVYRSKHSKDKKMALEAQNKVTEGIRKIDEIRQQLIKAQQDLENMSFSPSKYCTLVNFACIVVTTGRQ